MKARAALKALPDSDENDSTLKVSMRRRRGADAGGDPTITGTFRVGDHTAA